MKKIVWKIDDLFSLSLPFLFLYPLSTLIKFFSLFLSKPTSFQHHTHIEKKTKNYNDFVVTCSIVEGKRGENQLQKEIISLELLKHCLRVGVYYDTLLPSYIS